MSQQLGLQDRLCCTAQPMDRAALGARCSVHCHGVGIPCSVCDLRGVCCIADRQMQSLRVVLLCELPLTDAEQLFRLLTSTSFMSVCWCAPELGFGRPGCGLAQVELGCSMC